MAGARRVLSPRIRADPISIRRFLSRLGDLIERQQDQQTVSTTFEQFTRREPEIWSSALETGDLAPGAYLFRITVTDLSTQAAVFQERRFQVVAHLGK